MSLEPVSQLLLLCLFCTIRFPQVFAKMPVLLIEPLRCQCLSQVQTNKRRQAGRQVPIPPSLFLVWVLHIYNVQQTIKEKQGAKTGCFCWRQNKTVLLIVSGVFRMAVELRICHDAHSQASR